MKQLFSKFLLAFLLTSAVVLSWSEYFLKMSIIPNYYVVLIHIFPDLSNSWECAKCMNSGYSSVPSRQRHHNSGTADEEPDFKRSKSGDNNLASNLTNN